MPFNLFDGQPWPYSLRQAVEKEIGNEIDDNILESSVFLNVIGSWPGEYEGFKMPDGEDGPRVLDFIIRDVYNVLGDDLPVEKAGSLHGRIAAIATLMYYLGLHGGIEEHLPEPNE